VRQAFGRLPAARPPLQDAARFTGGGAALAMTTDAFVVKPLVFPGGDIGKLAICGTVNDLCAAGAHPRWLSVAVVIEEGLDLDLLAAIADSLAATAEAAGVEVIAGDTKVVERGAADGLYLVTSGVGELRDDARPRSDRVEPGDVVLVSGPVGDHGVAVLAARHGLPLDPPPRSDCAPLHEVAHAALDAGGMSVKCLRDPTRGGLAATLNEIAGDSAVRLRLDEARVPVREETRGVCELLGLDPLAVANEGKFAAVVSPDSADAVLEAMRASPLGEGACAIGEAIGSGPGTVTLRTSFGTERLLPMPSGELLPRIC